MSCVLGNVYEQKKQEALEAERILKEKEEKEAKEKVQYYVFGSTF